MGEGRGREKNDRTSAENPRKIKNDFKMSTSSASGHPSPWDLERKKSRDCYGPLCPRLVGKHVYVPDRQGHVDMVLPGQGFQEDLERHVGSVLPAGEQCSQGKRLHGKAAAWESSCMGKRLHGKVAAWLPWD